GVPPRARGARLPGRHPRGGLELCAPPRGCLGQPRPRRPRHRLLTGEAVAAQADRGGSGAGAGGGARRRVPAGLTPPRPAPRHSPPRRVGARGRLTLVGRGGRSATVTRPGAGACGKGPQAPAPGFETALARFLNQRWVSAPAPPQPAVGERWRLPVVEEGV